MAGTHDAAAGAATLAAADPLAPRTVLMHRRVVHITPARIEVRPPRSALVLPALGAAVAAALLAVLVVWTDDLPFWTLPLLLIGAVVSLPLAGMALVFAVFGASIVADRAGQNVSVKQRFLGLGVGTTELVPFWKIREFVVEDVGRAQPHARGADPAHAFAQWEVALVKKSGRRLRLGSYLVPRAAETDGLDRAMEVAEALAALSGAPIRGPIW